MLPSSFWLGWEKEKIRHLFIYTFCLKSRDTHSCLSLDAPFEIAPLLHELSLPESYADRLASGRRRAFCQCFLGRKMCFSGVKVSFHRFDTCYFYCALATFLGLNKSRLIFAFTLWDLMHWYIFWMISLNLQLRLGSLLSTSACLLCYRHVGY